MLLSSIIKPFESPFLNQYGGKILPSMRKALGAMKYCRTNESPLMLMSCADCDEKVYVPHSCGHRNCPHCQHHESQQWLERQLKKSVPAAYFLLTFTLPAQFRSLAWSNQRDVYNAMMQCSWETLKTFSQNDKHLLGIPGAIAVFHSHARDLGFHPHVHIIMPAAAIDKNSKLWRTKETNKGKPYLFNHIALAKVFRGKLLEAITQAGIPLPKKYPKEWVVHCKSVGSGAKALTYLGRYLYRGVIQEKNIVSCKDGNVTYRYQDNETKQWVYKTVSGEKFLWLLLQHVLPKRFRRARNFGFLHPNSKRLIQVLQLIKGIDPNRALPWMKKRPTLSCPCCGGEMKVVECLIPRIPTMSFLKKLMSAAPT